MNDWTRLTVEDVLKRLEEIRAIAGDDEAAHSSEDALREAVLEAIASGAANAQGLAAMALRTGEIEFARWCA